MTLLQRIMNRKNGAQELDLIHPAPAPQPEPHGVQCPFCTRTVLLNELVRSVSHVVGCRYCYY